jgi:hypothetical protein
LERKDLEQLIRKGEVSSETAVQDRLAEIQRDMEKGLAVFRDVSELSFLSALNRRMKPR